MLMVIDVIICEVCEEETDCEYLNSGDNKVCCPCDTDMDKNHSCPSCFSDLVSDAHDHYKGLQENDY